MTGQGRETTRRDEGCTCLWTIVDRKPDRSQPLVRLVTYRVVEVSP